MATRSHRLLRVIEFNTNGIGKHRYELSKQLQDLRVDAALFSGTHLKLRERFFIPNYHFYPTNHYLGRKSIPHNHVDHVELPPLVSVEATGGRHTYWYALILALFNIGIEYNALYSIEIRRVKVYTRIK
jgi:hypothetical protein